MNIRLDLLDRALAERSFLDFVRQAWPVLEPKNPYQENWHHELLAEALEAIAAGELLKLVINLAPRYGKSLFVSVLFPCWVWLHEPWERMLFASYSATLASDHSVARRTLIQSPWYTGYWRNIVTLAQDSNLKTEFTNTARGRMIATSVGASATGRGGNFIICDDLINPDQANSDIERSRALRWFDETFSTRLDDKKTGRQIVVEQRTHANDLTGHLLAEGDWYHIALPAIAERKTIIVFPRSHKQRVREEGDILWPDREGPVELERAKLRVGAFGFAAQFQQSPTPREGNLFKTNWFGTFQQMPKFDPLVQSWDCAFKTGEINDYSACITIGVVRKRREDSPAAPGFYVVHAWRGRVEFVELKRRAVEFYEQWNPSAVLVEDTASGQSLLQELRSNTNLPIKGVKPDSDKFSRAASVTPMVEGGRFFLPEGATWADDYRAEMTAFPGGVHDDFVDATVQGLSYVREPQDPTILVYYRELAAGERTRQAKACESQPKINPYELARFRLEADFCHLCKENLYMKSSITDGAGRLCLDCARKTGKMF